ncbi:MAG: lipid-A-disaccharide synthase [Candidatus Hydrogenedentes bacterium]|nr:lipid-A-disaccharide synthase [Candidatus Hydrogenedentota bacterium]
MSADDAIAQPENRQSQAPHATFRLFFVAGEASGDIHGANLIAALRALSPGIECEGLGGQRMAAAGMALRHDLAGEAIMGFTEVVKHFRGIRRLFLDTLAHIEDTRPDAVVLIDYPGFNIRLAKRLKQLGIPVVYYISPQVWAWKKKRIHTLAACVDKMLVIFPFEQPLYEKVGLPCRYVGHPLLDHISRIEGDGAAAGEMVIGLLPGSREQEIKRLLAPMLEVAAGIAKAHPEARFMTPVVDEARAAQAREIAGSFPLEIKTGSMYDILRRARFCMVASGTATLETALFGVPMVILYKVTTLTFWMAKFLVDIRYIGIVNILVGRGVVPEFIQNDIQPAQILPQALRLIAPSPERAQMIGDLREVQSMLGDGGASQNAAREILEVLDNTPP